MPRGKLFKQAKTADLSTIREEIWEQSRLVDQKQDDDEVTLGMLNHSCQPHQ